MRVLSEMYINMHYDDRADRIRRMFEAEKQPHLLDNCEQERLKALAIFKKQGYLEVDKVGQQWTIKEV